MTPNLGQGASQAMEDAPVLARELAAGPDLPTSLRRYEALRQKRTAPIVLRARRMGALAHWENPIARWLRDRVIALVPESAQLKQARSVLLPEE